MRLDRLLGIALELMAKKRVTAAELAAKFEVSIRTVYRDVELINQAGIPVASFTGADGGFELLNGFFLTRQHFSVDDLSVIYTLLKAMERAMGGAVAPAMRKLASLNPELANEGSCEALILSINTSDYERNIVQELFRAVRQSRVVRLAYTSASGTATERSVEPLNLLWEKGVWYLEGYCRSRRSKRYFRVSRIASLDVSEEMFVPRQIPDELERDEIQGIRAHLRFDLTVRTRVLEQFPGECKYQGDCIDVHTTFYKKGYALSVIASYGTNVEIVSPAELRDYIIAHIEAIRRHYARKRGGNGT
ncbi:helix-turn-helix transcriptional regulator [Paenibacillus arenilitoris]|uniref:YafY family transcriptional regulator n=1 Tax=Paenibacillus arenilitoris TaxID=2772299 RepID=A0A927H5P7_9BACL|nr:YafY family protein [Paenibacillus arenilitoris]MBD2869165.1 YafY family transcriptional regulator [Paenibacillus arenilitoris]